MDHCFHHWRSIIIVSDHKLANLQEPVQRIYHAATLYPQNTRRNFKGTCHQQLIPNLITGNDKTIRAGVAQWVARLTPHVEVVGSSPIKDPCCFLEQETLPLLLSIGCFQEQIWVWYHNQTTINWGPYGRLT